ncbi:DUF4145 domain-containing protein [Metapseudomonas sp. CR1201]
MQSEMESRTIAKDRTIGEEVRIVCLVCKIPQRHKVLTSLDEMVNDDCFGSHASYQIAQCLNCDSLCFRRDYTDSESHHRDDETGEEIEFHDIAVYPNRTAGRFKVKNDFYLPLTVRSAYTELVAAMNGGQPILAGLGIRVLVETVCRDKNAEGKTLYNKIDDLVRKGVLTPVDAEILHKLRSLGNEAAHEAKPSSDEQLNLAMDVVDHLLLGAYIHPMLAKNAFKG